MPETAIAIVIPVRNEGPFLSPALEQITRQVQSVRLDYRIVLVENGSVDDTGQQAVSLAGDDPRALALRLPRADYGRSVRRGMEEAAAPGRGWIILFHLDRFSGEFVQYAMNSAADVITDAGSMPETPDGGSRFGHRALKALGRLTGLPSGVAYGGRRLIALRAPVAAALLSQIEREHDLFDAEMLIRAEMSGYQTEEAPVAVEELRPPRSSFLRSLPGVLRGMLVLRRSLRGNPPRPAGPR